MAFGSQDHSAAHFLNRASDANRIGFIILADGDGFELRTSAWARLKPAEGLRTARRVETRTHWQASGHEGAVSTGGPRRPGRSGDPETGGNATDAAVAVILALSVTDSRSFCFGGEVPMLVYNAKTHGVTVDRGRRGPRRIWRPASISRLAGGIPGQAASRPPRCRRRWTPA